MKEQAKKIKNDQKEIAQSYAAVVKGLLADCKGQAFSEYGMIVGAVLVGIAAGLYAFRDAIKAKIAAATSALGQ